MIYTDFHNSIRDMSKHEIITLIYDYNEFIKELNEKTEQSIPDLKRYWEMRERRTNERKQTCRNATD